ncbi:MFS transporter [Salinimonas marina]|uniref:MFS transporter n=1 Tax=Salinimonas marina TaxID=2785918 RepID=A0A7S9DX37_9ALTE|nr:MFS transporter [Salinimonas marina]QPG04855.1 MFS transporter [Salinimonas marina]
MTSPAPQVVGPAHQPLNFLLLAITYLLYFGQLGVLVPYLGIFLDGRGFTSADIGNLFAVITLSRIIGPSLWASLADKTGRTAFILRAGCLLSALSFTSVFYFSGFWGLTLSFGLMMMFWTAVLPQLEVITMQSVAPTRVSYGKIRLWGSIGFIVFTVAVGKALDVFSSETPVIVSMGVLSALFVASLFIRQPATPRYSEGNRGSVWRYVTRRPFVVFLVSATLLQISFGPYYGFFALYLRDLQYTGQQTGFLIALGVAAEVGIFLLASRLISRFGVWWLLMVCMLGTAARWYAFASFAHYPWVVIAAQLIHALSFGLTHAASVHFIHRFLPAQYHSRGQALYISVAFGLGGALGNYGAGQLWEQGTNAELTFMLAAFTGLLGGLIMLGCRPQQMNHSVSVQA